MNVPSHADLEAIIASYDEPIRHTARNLDRLLLSRVEHAYRTGSPGDGTIGYQRGPGYKGTVFTIILSKRNVKLGVPYGTDLPDPDRLLQGTGKVHRFIPFNPGQPIETPEILAMVGTAIQAWEDRSASHS